jgi:uncharacterized protein YndB with AHSA1/START domain
MKDENKPRVIELQVTIHAPRGAVWAALSEPSELARWFPPTVEGKPGFGEMLVLSWGPEVHWRTRVAAWEPGRHLRWQDVPASAEPGAPSPVPMAVDWTLEASGGEVVVRLVQSGFGEGETWDDYYDGTDIGWRFFLNALRHYLERHRGMARTMVSIRRPARGGPLVPWKRLWSPEGLFPTAAVESFAPGKAFELSLGRERLAGTVDFVRAPSHFWGRVENLNDAPLLVEMEVGRDRLHCGIWLSTYGVSVERTQSVQRELTAMADRAFNQLD